uniref:Uncharacterized protein n=1 Tax=Anguilla anguilla TaxID=7936 RepID=A0A0E9T8W2_ANGAN
MFDLLSNRRNQ